MANLTTKNALSQDAKNRSRDAKVGSKPAPVQRMGLGSIYDQVKLAPDVVAAYKAKMNGPSKQESGLPAGGQSVAKKAATGSSAVGKKRAAGATSFYDPLAAYRAQIQRQYIDPTNALYDTATGEVGQDLAPTAAAYAGAADQATQQGQANAALEAQAAQTRSGQRNAAAALMGFLPSEVAQGGNAADAAGQAYSTYDTAVGGANAALFNQQAGTAQGRIQAAIDALNNQRQAQLAAIAAKYGM